MKLVSEVLSIDDHEQAVELFFERGGTDGLPVCCRRASASRP